MLHAWASPMELDSPGRPSFLCRRRPFRTTLTDHPVLSAMAWSVNPPLIKLDDVAGFAREMPVSERAAIGRKCRDLVEKRFSLPIMHANYAKVYAHITDKKTKLRMIQSS